MRQGKREGFDSPSAMRCSGTCNVILTTSGQFAWEAQTRPMTQLVILMSVRVVLLMGLLGEPTAKIKQRRVEVKVTTG